jgi:hypothetical protein
MTVIIAVHLPGQETGNAVEKVYDRDVVVGRPPTTPTQAGGDPAPCDVLCHATATVSNTGYRSGQVVPQLYLSLPTSSTPSSTPVKVLRRFAVVGADPRADCGRRI